MKLIIVQLKLERIWISFAYAILTLLVRSELLILSVSEVEVTLLNLDASKATGPDELLAKFLKETADVIAASLTELLNKFLGFLIMLVSQSCISN